MLGNVQRLKICFHTMTKGKRAKVAAYAKIHLVSPTTCLNHQSQFRNTENWK